MPRSYKYNERAIVFNHKNMIRLWDVAYDGYNGGKSCDHVEWRDPEDVGRFMRDTYELNRPYEVIPRAPLRMPIVPAYGVSPRRARA